MALRAVERNAVLSRDARTYLERGIVWLDSVGIVSLGFNLVDT